MSGKSATGPGPQRNRRYFSEEHFFWRHAEQPGLWFLFVASENAMWPRERPANRYLEKPNLFDASGNSRVCRQSLFSSAPFFRQGPTPVCHKLGDGPFWHFWHCAPQGGISE